MFPATALAVVKVTDGHPLDALGPVVPGDSRESDTCLAGNDVLALTRFVGIGIDGTHEHVVAEAVQMTPVAEPHPGRGDAIGGGFALGLHQHRHIQEIVAVPGGPGFQ
jgi:hypothetical protein